MNAAEARKKATEVNGPEALEPVIKPIIEMITNAVKDGKFELSIDVVGETYQKREQIKRALSDQDYIVEMYHSVKNEDYMTIRW